MSLTLHFSSSKQKGNLGSNPWVALFYLTMPKLLDVTIRMVEYAPDGVVLPYVEHRIQIPYEDLPESLQAGENDLTICRYVAENCMPMEPLFPKD